MLLLWSVFGAYRQQELHDWLEKSKNLWVAVFTPILSKPSEELLR
jgi:hypothetical protein